jgi:hypothetical protein
VHYSVRSSALTFSGFRGTMEAFSGSLGSALRISACNAGVRER